MATKRIIWIDEVKFIACLAVFGGHYCNVFSFSILQSNSIFNYPIAKLFCVFIMGNWWVYVFCIISGALATNKTIKSFGQLIGALFNRYLRFVLPVLIANMIVFLCIKLTALITMK